MKKILLSIVIPTKNRKIYCLEALKQILSLNLKDIEIIIQDNSDGNSLKSEIRKLNSEDIVYHYHGGILSFVDNFSEAISLVNGEYVCMIGDDDGILPNIIDLVKYAKENNVDAIVPGLNSVYCWPSEKGFVKNGQNGYLCLSYIKNNIKEINCLKGLNDLMQRGGQDYQSLDIPRVYHGIVKKEMLDLVRNRTGRYFNGLTPDIYMSVTLALVCNKVCKIGYPVTISGICPGSGSANSATGMHTGRLKDAPHFKGHDEYEWDEKVPAIYSVESIWAETVLHALKDFDAYEQYSNFRVDILDAICLKQYPQFSKEIINHAKKYNISRLHLLVLGNSNKLSKTMKKIYSRIIRKKDDVKKFYDVHDIQCACYITSKELGCFRHE